MPGRKRRSRRRRAELSQHFLRRDSASRLVQATSISNADLVLEIGAGRGALTESIVRQTSRLIAIEIDPYLTERLCSEYGETAEVIESDFLSYDLPDEPYLIIGNVPFSKSTEIIRKIANASNPPTDAWLVVQQELAGRMCGLPFSRESPWSLRLKPYWHLEIIDRLNRHEFNPPPAVDSVFLHLSHRCRPIVEPKDFQAYIHLIESAFKSNSTVLKALRPGLTKLQIRRLANDLRFNPADQPAELMFEQWLGIFRFWNRNR